ncbi:MAG: DNA cytosine methyltransferase [Dermatophilaceae bacterium]
MTGCSGPRLGSLFSGTGGLDLALQRVFGARTVWVCDTDPGASAVLAHHWPHVPNLGDITAVDWARTPRVQVLTGGFPCQDVSTAGARAGLRPGTRSGLWSHMAHAIDRLRPDLVLAENVRGLLSAPAASDVEPCPWCLGDQGRPALRALGAVLADLADLGYDAAWVGLRAADVGAPHGRYRVFVAAWPSDTPRDAWWLRHRDRSAAADPAGKGRQGRCRPRPQDTAGLGRGRPDHHALFTDPLAGDADRASLRHSRGNDTLLGALLPTPRASDGSHGGPNQRGSNGDLMLPSAVALLPTPVVKDMGEGRTVAAWDQWAGRMRDQHRNGNGHGDSLAIEAQRLALTPNPTQPADRWGRSGAAVRRWEHLTRPVPAPTQPSTSGGTQLAPEFVEWLMGLPSGHVTNPAIWAGLTDHHDRPITPQTRRRMQLQALGNGVVPQQAVTATQHLLGLARAALRQGPEGAAA